jgi:hypothetical protein
MKKNSEIFVELSKNQDLQLIKVIHKVTLSFTSYTLFLAFSGIHKVRKFLLNLNMKCWNSAFNARFESNYSNCTRRNSEHICSSRGDETQCTTNIGGKTSLGPSYFCFVKFHSELLVRCWVLVHCGLLPPTPLILFTKGLWMKTVAGFIEPVQGRKNWQ